MAVARPIMLPFEQKDFTRRKFCFGMAVMASPVAITASETAADSLSIREPDLQTHPVLALPFVRDTDKSERAAGLPSRLFWSVDPSGHYAEDCVTGAAYAVDALDYMSTARSPHILQWSVFDMMTIRRAHSGIEVGFLSVFGQLAASAHAASFKLEGVVA